MDEETAKYPYVGYDVLPSKIVSLSSLLYRIDNHPLCEKLIAPSLFDSIIYFGLLSMISFSTFCGCNDLCSFLTVSCAPHAFSNVTRYDFTAQLKSIFTPKSLAIIFEVMVLSRTFSLLLSSSGCLSRRYLDVVEILTTGILTHNCDSFHSQKFFHIMWGEYLSDSWIRRLSRLSLRSSQNRDSQPRQQLWLTIIYIILRSIVAFSVSAILLSVGLTLFRVGHRAFLNDDYRTSLYHASCNLIRVTLDANDVCLASEPLVICILLAIFHSYFLPFRLGHTGCICSHFSAHCVEDWSSKWVSGFS